MLFNPHIVMALKMLQQLDFSKRSFSKNGLVKDLCDFFDSNLFTVGDIFRGTAVARKRVGGLVCVARHSKPS